LDILYNYTTGIKNYEDTPANPYLATVKSPKDMALPGTGIVLLVNCSEILE